MNLKYLDLPAIPDEIINEILDDINQRLLKKEPNIEYPNWQSFMVNKKVKEFIQKSFDPFHIVSVFYLTRGLPIHKDITRNTAYNYIIDTGGNSITSFYDENKKLTESFHIEGRRWIELNVKEWHSVDIPEPPRIVLTVSKPWQNRRDLENCLIEDESICKYYDMLSCRASNDDECFMDLYRKYCDFTKGNITMLGCGPGHAAIRLAKEFPELSITGYDGSQAMVDLALKNIGKNDQIKIKKSMFHEINEKVDCIVSLQTLHRQYDPIGALWFPMKLMAKPKTKVFITDFERPENTEFLSNLNDEELKNSIIASYTKEEVESHIEYLYLNLKVERLPIKGSPLNRLVVYGEID